MLKLSNSSGKPGSVLAESSPYGTGNFGQFGLAAKLSHDGRASREVMAPGFQVRLEADYYFKTWDVREDFGTIDGLLAGYVPLGSRFLLAAGVAGKTVRGDAPFFEAAFLGGSDSLLGHNPNRFTGDSSLLGMTELRARVKTLTFPIPATIGLTGGVQAGRVFSEGESSRRWHPSAGGGVFYEMLRGFSVFSLSVWTGERVTVHFSAGVEF